MANKKLFTSTPGKLVPATDTVNEAGGKAYRFPPKQALAQLAATGCLNATFYAAADQQLAAVADLCAGLDAEFIARTAVFCREEGYMKDMPALLLAFLAAKDGAWLERVFDRVVDGGKMLRNFVQIVRSGAVGRKSLGSLPKRLARRWLERRSPGDLLADAVGNDPSLADVIKMVHPKPADDVRAALYGYLLGKPHDAELLPDVIRHFEAYKRGERTDVPDVPFRLLTSLELGQAEWREIARNAPWQMTRMNLNTFCRHGVFDGDEGPAMARLVAERLACPEQVRRSRVFPYQLLTAYTMAGDSVPPGIREALQDALEVALENVPAIEGKVYVLPDVSGSMASPVTGHRRGATTAVRCVDVAALVAAAILRKNPSAEVLPFETDVVKLRLNPRDSVMTNARALAAIGGGGTNCSAPLAQLNRGRAAGDLVVFVSDNESWVDGSRGARGTAVMHEWQVFKERNPEARLVCIDIQPYVSSQAAERDDILNVGGFSDHVFELLAAFAQGRLSPDHWVGVIEGLPL